MQFFFLLFLYAFLFHDSINGEGKRRISLSLLNVFCRFSLHSFPIPNKKLTKGTVRQVMNPKV